MESFAMELLKQSPAPALRAAQRIAEVYQPIVDDLFKPAFYFCWVITQGVEMGVASMTALEPSPSTIIISVSVCHTLANAGGTGTTGPRRYVRFGQGRTELRGHHV